MILFFFSLSLFVASPFLLIALAAKSKALVLAGLMVGWVYSSFFFLNAFSEFLAELRGTSVDDAVNRRLHAFWEQTDLKRVDVRFWIYPSSQAQFKIWVSGQKLEVFFSQGLLNLATDAGLKAAFQSIAKMNLSDIKLQNRRHALTLRLERLKGPEEDFRFWFLSFWLYPLERFLKIAKI